MAQKILIDNQTKYPMQDIYNFLAGFTTDLNGKIETKTTDGKYYDTLIIKDKNKINIPDYSHI